MKYSVHFTLHYSYDDYINVDAESEAQAEQIVHDMIHNGEMAFDSDDASFDYDECCAFPLLPYDEVQDE